MALWENTLYLRCGDVERVLVAMDAVVAAEGMEPMAPPAPRERVPGRYEPMQYLGALQNDVWGAAILPGAPGWCVIKTAPLDLLVDRAAGAPHMRLVDLCRRLECDALHFAAYDGPILLTEVTANGDVALSGYYASGDDPLVRHGETIDEDHVDPALRLLSLPIDVDFGGHSEDASRALGEVLGGPQAEARDNGISVSNLVRSLPLAPLTGQVRYWRWVGPSRQQEVRPLRAR